MVGDTEYDLAMAAAIAMPSLGLEYSVHEGTVSQLQHKPALITDRFALVVDWILARSLATSGFCQRIDSKFPRKRLSAISGKPMRSAWVRALD